MRIMPDDRLAAVCFEVLFASPLQGVIGVDAEGRIQLINQMAETLFGYAHGELQGQSIDVLVPERIRQIHAEEREEYADHPRIRPMGLGIELRGRRRDGSEFPVEISLYPMRGEASLLALAMVSDISARHRMESNRRWLHKMEAVSELASKTATRFQAILGEVARDTGALKDAAASDPAAQTVVESIAASAGRGVELAQVLSASHSPQNPAPVWLDVNQRLNDLHGTLAGMLGENVALELHLDENLGECLADPAQLDRVILNLVRNAGEAMSRGGTLSVETAAIEVGESDDRWFLPVAPGPYVLLVISDNGRGMSLGVSDRIFEPFFTTKAGAQGLGLSAVYGILRDSGGSIFVSSELNRGSRFEVIFPRIWQKS